MSVDLADVYEKRAVSGTRTVSVNIDENALAPLGQFSGNDRTGIDPGDSYAPGVAWPTGFGGRARVRTRPLLSRPQTPPGPEQPCSSTG